ncbi:MAG: RNA helicase, partial [Gammaproteobacteria bacterium]|nr:RNA helicase [Gammaproteobacteria bacterium]
TGYRAGHARGHAARDPADGEHHGGRCGDGGRVRGVHADGEPGACGGVAGHRGGGGGGRLGRGCRHADGQYPHVGQRHADAGDHGR